VIIRNKQIVCLYVAYITFENMKIFLMSNWIDNMKQSREEEIKNEKADEYHVNAAQAITLPDSQSKEIQNRNESVNDVRTIDITDCMQRRITFHPFSTKNNFDAKPLAK